MGTNKEERPYPHVKPDFELFYAKAKNVINACGDAAEKAGVHRDIGEYAAIEIISSMMNLYLDDIQAYNKVHTT